MSRTPAQQTTGTSTGAQGATAQEAPTLDQGRVEEFAGQVVTDIGATVAAATTYIGHRTGLYAAMDGAGPLTADELAARTGTHERYVREWLNAQAAGGYLHFDPEASTYELPPEHAAVLVDRASPVYLAGSADCMAAVWAAVDRVAEDFTAGEGVGWHEHDPRLFAGTEEFFRPSYEAFLTTEWIPALDGVEERLTAGATVADVGCGHGASTITMARAYPASRIHGFDYHEESIGTARRRAADAGVADRATFAVAPSTGFPGSGYDLICFFDCLHDMGDPVGALAHTRQALAGHGTVMLLEPFAGDTVEDNLTPVGRLYYAASTLLCTANGISQGASPVLGAQAGEARLREVLAQAGFTRVRRAGETPFNLVIEARP